MNWIYENYWISIILQIICVVHAFKKGLNNWIYIIVFIPFVGCVAYFVVEIFPLLKSGQLGFITDQLFMSRESIADLEKKLRISDTFVNRCNLANAYAAKNNFAKAIELYESSLTDIYKDDLEALLQLGRLNFLEKNYARSIHYFERAKANNNNKFIRPDDELWLGISYLENGQNAQAETVLKNHIQFQRTVDSMYYYAELLMKENRMSEAKTQLETILDYRDMLPNQNIQYYLSYVRKAKKALQGL